MVPEKTTGANPRTCRAIERTLLCHDQCRDPKVGAQATHKIVFHSQEHLAHTKPMISATPTRCTCGASCDDVKSITFQDAAAVLLHGQVTTSDRKSREQVDGDGWWFYRPPNPMRTLLGDAEEGTQQLSQWFSVSVALGVIANGQDGRIILVSPPTKVRCSEGHCHTPGVPLHFV